MGAAHTKFGGGGDDDLQGVSTSEGEKFPFVECLIDSPATQNHHHTCDHDDDGDAQGNSNAMPQRQVRMDTVMAAQGRVGNGVDWVVKNRYRKTQWDRAEARDSCW